MKSLKCCMSTDVGTWTNWLTFDPDPDYSPDAGIGLLSPLLYKWWYAEFYVGKIQRMRISCCRDAWFYNGLFHWANEPSKHLCRRYMRSTKCPRHEPSVCRRFRMSVTLLRPAEMAELFGKILAPYSLGKWAVCIKISRKIKGVLGEGDSAS